MEKVILIESTLRYKSIYNLRFLLFEKSQICLLSALCCSVNVMCISNLFLQQFFFYREPYCTRNSLILQYYILS